METLDHLFENNRKWSERIRQVKPEFFLELARQQAPKYLWIGCSDSRVPANQIVGLAPGELFVHRNIANLVIHTDLNCLSVLQFAVEILKVRHIIVCGHYGCSGVTAALRKDRLGLSDNWLRHVQDIRQKNETSLQELPENQAIDRLCELNVIEQVGNVCCTTIIEDAPGPAARNWRCMAGFTDCTAACCMTSKSRQAAPSRDNMTRTAAQLTSSRRNVSSRWQKIRSFHFTRA